MAQYLLTLLADVVVQALTPGRCAFLDEMNRYMSERKFRPAPVPNQAQTR